MRNKKNLTRGTNLIPLITGYWEQSCQRSDLIQAQLKGGFFSSSRSIGRGSDPPRGYRGGPGAEPSHPAPCPASSTVKVASVGTGATVALAGPLYSRARSWASSHLKETNSLKYTGQQTPPLSSCVVPNGLSSTRSTAIT